MANFPDAEWLAAYRERVNADAEMKVIGDWFTTTFSFAFGEFKITTTKKGREFNPDLLFIS